MLDTIARATPADFAAVWQLYADVCAQDPHDPYGAHWVYGVYPSEDDIRSHIDKGQLYVGRDEGHIVAAMAVVPHDDPEYADVPWPTPATPDEVAVIHLLCVHPSMRGRHMGAELVQEALRLAREAGKRVVHLDVYPGNLAASRIYLEAGFVLVGTFEVFYEDTGTMPFEMLECVL